jgi:D-alanyl-lipoteichoic acid acyltransferase DltB (MBOAT superfamily)
MTNFKTPYFSRDIAEFWRRWHISLSTWFRDYLYIPLGGSRVGKWKAVRNVFIIFLVSGFWHGANWTFIVWGGIHACLFLPLLLRGTNRRFTSETIGEGRWLPSGRELLGMAWTFTTVCVAWVFFRAESLTSAIGYLGSLGTRVTEIDLFPKRPTTYIFLLVGIEAAIRRRWGLNTRFIDFLIFLVSILTVSHFILNEGGKFIYFQF